MTSDVSVSGNSSGTAKAAFLARLRSAIGPGAPPPQRAFAVVERPPDVVPAWTSPAAPLGERWAAAFEALGGHVHRTGPDGVDDAITAAVGGRGPVLVDHRVARGVGPRSPDEGASPDEQGWMEWPGCGIEAAATGMVGVVEATAGIAATGTIVVDSGRTGRLVSLLPRVGVFVLREADIVPLTGDILRTHKERWPEGPPTNVVFVTGPSRSGDIEMRLVVGVHGPGEVHAVLVES
jgi:L-lactate utilization protein LutC